MAITAGETNPVKRRTPLTPHQVERAKVRDEIDEARVDAYDTAISEVHEAVERLDRIREQIEASAQARAKLVADWPKADGAEPAYVPVRFGEDSSLWQHRCGLVTTSRYEPADKCVRCDLEPGPVLPGDWRQLYVRAGETEYADG